MPKNNPTTGAAWLSVRDAAARLGVSARTVRRRLERGEIAGEIVPLSGGGRAWRVAFDASGQPQNLERTDSVRPSGGTSNGQRAANANERKSERLAARGQETAKQSDSVRPSAPALIIEREPTRREIEQQDEIKFLRATVEQLQRDCAETRASLRAALKLSVGESAPQLTTGTQPPARESAPSDATAPSATTIAPQRPLTYGDIADQLEKRLNQ